MKPYFQLLRPYQWIKNFFVFAAIIFSGQFFNTGFLTTTIYTFIVFCLISSGVYIFNDIFDKKEDAKNPYKKHRPIASGSISVREGIFIGILLTFIALIFSFWINTWLFYLILIYFILNLLYSKWLKQVVIIDALILSIGYVLRVIAGAVVIKVEISPWIIVATLTLSLMIAFSKRYSEFLNHRKGRKVLKIYTEEFLQHLITLSAGLTIMIYFLWCIENRHGLNQFTLVFSSVFVIYGIMRYLYLTLCLKEGISPTKIIIKDKHIVLTTLLWLIYMFILFY